MKKNSFICRLAALTKGAAAVMMAAAMTVAASGLTACSSEDSMTDGAPGGVIVVDGPAYMVSIPATLGDGAAKAQTRAVDFGETTIASKFATGEKVYAYLEHGGATYATYDGSGYATLSPTGISTDGRTADLSGALKFYSVSGDTYTPVAPTAGDQIHLYYLMNRPDQSAIDAYFYYSDDQDGSAATAGAFDFAETTMEVKTVAGDASAGYTLELCQPGDATNTTAHLANLGSMFRQRLTFKSQGGDALTPTIKRLRLSSASDAIVMQYNPMQTDADKYGHGTVDITKAGGILDASGDAYFALMFRGSDGSDALTLTATDTDNKQYAVTKAAPEGGFQNGKYYYGASALTQQPIPTVYDNLTHAASTVTPNENGRYDYDTGSAVDLTISGASSGYYFLLEQAGTVTLADGLAASLPDNSAFIRSIGNLTLVLGGAATVSCPKIDYAVTAGYDAVTFCGSGSLAITVGGNYYHGISANGGIGAARGYTLTRNDATNGDGTYTYTYAVTERYVAPTVTDNQTHAASSVTPDATTHVYSFTSAADVTLSGESSRHAFSLAAGGTVGLGNGTAALEAVSLTAPFITTGGALTLDVKGANELYCPGSARAVGGSGAVTLSGRGTIRVTTTTNGGGLAASVSAATGLAVTTGAVTDNGDGTYTQTYTVGRDVSGAVNLGTMSCDYTVSTSSGEVLTGTLSGGHHVIIPAGYSVTLADVTISATDEAGIVCLGSASIELDGENSVTAQSDTYPAIQPGGSGTTLTISGTGSLTATGGKYAAGIGSGYSANCGDITISGGTITATGGYGGAGIGGGEEVTCGNITITGGTITATGGTAGAGIGGGYGDSYQHSVCGNIEIRGGTVTAQGGSNCPGIGAGDYYGDCGNITIRSTVTSVTAKKGNSAPVSIGAGANNSTCGTVTIEDPSKVTQQ